jgi:toxin ParE1/3/4
VKRRLTLSPEAAADLEEIRQYTAERFGEDQARRYLSGFREAFEQLASYPDSGREIASGSEIRCWIHRGHYRVLYRERADRLEIGRVIHVSREQELLRALELLQRRS